MDSLIVPFPLYAEHARQARGRDLTARCAVCGREFGPSDRVADLVNGAGIACVAGCIDYLARAS